MTYVDQLGIEAKIASLDTAAGTDDHIEHYQAVSLACDSIRVPGEVSGTPVASKHRNPHGAPIGARNMPPPLLPNSPILATLIGLTLHERDGTSGISSQKRDENSREEKVAEGRVEC